jgi:hypothetical protein
VSGVLEALRQLSSGTEQRVTRAHGAALLLAEARSSSPKGSADLPGSCVYGSMANLRIPPTLVRASTENTRAVYSSYGIIIAMAPKYPGQIQPQPSERRDLLVSKGWIQAVAVVVLFGFFVMGLLAYRTYSSEAPIPARVVGPAGVLFTREDIVAGQQVFLRNGLMEYGSIFGHGAYLGPDFTAAVANSDGGGKTAEQARAQTALEFKTNRYDADTDTLVFTPAQSAAYTKLVVYYGGFFSEPSTHFGLRPKAISNPTEIKQLTAFFSWSAWAAAALRPGRNYSYTNN